MKSVYNFVVTPKGERYNNKKKVGDSELILNTEIFNHQYINRQATVISTPIIGNTNIEVGDEDMSLISSVQRGMENECFTQGPLGRNEIGLFGFARRLRQVLPVSTKAEPPAEGEISSLNLAMLLRKMPE